MKKEQNKRFHALLTATGLTEAKAQLVFTYSNGESSSSKDLNDEQAAAMLAWLEKQPTIATNPQAESKRKPSENATLIRAAVSHFRHIGFVVTDKPDWTRINEFCVQRSATKKRMDKMTKAELNALITQVKMVTKHTYTKVKISNSIVNNPILGNNNQVIAL